MLKAIKRRGFWLMINILVLSPLLVYGQSLGSSNGLFRSPNPATKKKSSASTEKKTAPKTAASKKTTAKKITVKTAPKNNSARNASRNSPAKTSSRRKTESARNSNAKTSTAKKSETKTPAIKPDTVVKPPINSSAQNSVVITVGKPVKGNVEELFDKAIDEGNWARDERNYVAAETSYRYAHNLKPRDSRAVYGLGNIFSDQQRWEEAEKAYRQAISLEPDSPEANIALSFVLTQPLPGTNLSERYAEAEQTARRAIRLDANNPIAYDQLGVALELGGHIGAETQNAYRRAIELDPNFALAYAHLGRLLRRNGLSRESNAAYRNAIRLSSDVPTMILVADVMQSQQRYEESEQLLERALAEDPRNPTALYLLGRAFTISGNFDEAEALLKKSVEISPNSFVSYTLLGSLYARRGLYDKAERILTLALQVVSANERKRLAQEFEAVGDGLMRVGRNIDAARVYRQAITLNNEKTDLTAKLNKAERS
jgi:superkiller protein 3